jgi:hypothetical protein
MEMDKNRVEDYKDMILYLWNVCGAGSSTTLPFKTGRAWEFLRALQFEREQLEVDAELCGRALSGEEAAIKKLGVHLTLTNNESLSQLLTYPLDVARMITQSIYGTEGRHIDRCVDEGKMMFGERWKDDYIREKSDAALREQELADRSRQEAHQAQEALMMSLLGHDSTLPPLSS